MANFVLWLVIGFQLLTITTADRPVVTTNYGDVMGQSFTLYTGKEIQRFHGIPFAAPPTGDLRFKAPQAPEKWDGVYNAETLQPVCPQSPGGWLLFTHPLWNSYDENCLFMNIYAPYHANSSEALYPVIVWLHGGGYTGSGNIQFPGHFIAGLDVVFVAINYRLGELGFMSTADDASPGNYGLRDQIMALEYVRDNIRAFGGDPDQVTLAGQSAGAASTGILMSSPLAQGLFHAAICESGGDMAHWALEEPNQRPEEYTKAVASQLGCPTSDSHEMMDCLREVDADDLWKSSFNCTSGYFCQGFAPVVDGPGGVLPYLPYVLRQRGEFQKVPMILGQTADDGSLYTASIIPEATEGGFTREEFEHHLKTSFMGMFTDAITPHETDAFEALNFYYSPWPHIDDEDSNRYAMNVMTTDFGFGFTGDQQLKSQVAHQEKVYQYILDYRSPAADEMFPPWMGVPHNGELPYVIGWPLLQLDRDVRRDSGILIDLIKKKKVPTATLR